jgi:hypothetical protein
MPADDAERGDRGAGTRLTGYTPQYASLPPQVDFTNYDLAALNPF